MQNRVRPSVCSIQHKIVNGHPLPSSTKPVPTSLSRPSQIPLPTPVLSLYPCTSFVAVSTPIFSISFAKPTTEKKPQQEPQVVAQREMGTLVLYPSPQKTLALSPYIFGYTPSVGSDIHSQSSLSVCLGGNTYRTFITSHNIYNHFHLTRCISQA